MQNTKSLLELISSGSVEFFVGLFLGIIVGYFLCVFIKLKTEKNASANFDKQIKAFELLLEQKEKQIQDLSSGIKGQAYIDLITQASKKV